MPARMGQARPLAGILEKEWDADLFKSARPVGLAVTLGWHSYHTLRSKGSKSGYPDRTLWRERILFAELKREKTAPTDEQVRILTGLASAGAEVYLWRPSDLDEIARILGHRQRFLFDVYGVPVLSERTGSSGAHWQPGSLWLPAGCRSDERGVA